MSRPPQLLNRPDDPIGFISAYLDEVVNGVSPVTKAYRRLKLVGQADTLDQRVVDLLWPIYQSLSTERKPSGKQGLVGSAFMQLLGMLCSDLSPQVRAARSSRATSNGISIAHARQQCMRSYAANVATVSNADQVHNIVLSALLAELTMLLDLQIRCRHANGQPAATTPTKNTLYDAKASDTLQAKFELR